MVTDSGDWHQLDIRYNENVFYVIQNSFVDVYFSEWSQLGEKTKIMHRSNHIYSQAANFLLSSDFNVHLISRT